VFTSSSGQGLLQKGGDGDIPKRTETLVLNDAVNSLNITVVGQASPVGHFTISLTTESSNTLFNGIVIPVAVSVN